MTTTMTLAEWLEVQLVADEAVARDVRHQAAMGRPFIAIKAGGTGVREMTNPDRWLAQIAATREALEIAHAMDDGSWGWQQMSENLIRTLAKPYAGRDGYAEVAG